MKEKLPDDFNAAMAREIANKKLEQVDPVRERWNAAVDKRVAKLEKEITRQLTKAAQDGRNGIYVIIRDYRVSRRYRIPVMQGLGKVLEQRGFAVAFVWERGLIMGRHVFNIEW